MDNRGVIHTKERNVVKIENPFSLKVGQVFTGFGVGCGVGIGVGRPIYLGAIPVLNPVMVATRGATDVFSGFQSHVNNSLRKVGVKNIEAGIGCGVGFGHGFGIGIAVKPNVLHQIQSHVLQAVTGLMKKIGIDSHSTLSVNQGILPSLQTNNGVIRENVTGNPEQLVKSVSDTISNGTIRKEKSLGNFEETSVPETAPFNVQYQSRTEAVLNNFLNNPLLKEEGVPRPIQDSTLKLENLVIQMVLKHQVLIDELMQENEKLRDILMRELKVNPSKLNPSFSCTECFECRQRRRKRMKS